MAGKRVKVPSGEKTDRRRLFLYCLLVAGLTFLAFLPVLSNGFVNWDDNFYVTENPDIRGWSLHNVGQVLSTSYVGVWVPLTMLSYMADYSLFGLHPAGCHAVNLLLHCVNAALVFLLLFGLTGRKSAALIACLLWAVHPLRVESVAWISERKDVLSALGYLLSLDLYLLYRLKRRKELFLLCGVAFIVALLAKPMAISLPLILLCIDYLQGRRIDKKAIIEKLPLFAIAAVFTWSRSSWSTISGQSPSPRCRSSTSWSRSTASPSTSSNLSPRCTCRRIIRIRRTTTGTHCF